ncbi:MFS transporter [Chitinivorax sp. B]|uniref:MFS transporter n=1 Tax=Chitinivorax sp. B TaxID=2502235 RepID=UPI0010F9D366|nr:MFS transporter [Chitinivorax sp. B]
MLTLRTFIAQHVQIYTRRATALPGILFWFHTCMFIALLTFVPRLMSDSDRASLAFIMPLCGVAGTFVAGVLAQFFITPVRLTALCFAFVGVTAIGLPWMVAIGAVVPAALGLLFVSGLVQGSVFTTVPYLARQPEDQAYSHGAVAQLGNLGATVGPPVIAWYVDGYGLNGMVIPVLVLALTGMALALWASRGGSERRAGPNVLLPETR